MSEHFSNYLSKLANTYGGMEENTDRDLENNEKIERMYELRRKMNPLKKFIKSNRMKFNTKEEFFEKNKFFFENNKIKEYSDFIKILNEVEEEEKKEKRAKNEKLKKEVNVNNDSIIKQKNKSLVIDHQNQFSHFSINAKKFNDSKLCQEGNLNIEKEVNNNYKLLLISFKTNEYNFNPNKIEFIIEKSKSYSIENYNKEQIIPIKKIKYNETELTECSSLINIIYEKIKIRKENTNENGLSLDELRIMKKRKKKKISNVEKLKKIMERIENQSIINKIIKQKNIPLKYIFCINCYECFDPNEIDKHNDHFLFKVIDFKDDEDELDYNERLNLLYENLKKIQKKILKNRDKKLMKYYGALLFSLYDIINNNNSYDELIISIININENYIKEFELGTSQGIFKDLFLLFCQKISKLAYFKYKELSFSELYKGNDKNNELENELNNFLN